MEPHDVEVAHVVVGIMLVLHPTLGERRPFVAEAGEGLPSRRVVRRSALSGRVEIAVDLAHDVSAVAADTGLLAGHDRLADRTSEPRQQRAQGRLVHCECVGQPGRQRSRAHAQPVITRMRAPVVSPAGRFAVIGSLVVRGECQWVRSIGHFARFRAALGHARPHGGRPCGHALARREPVHGGDVGGVVRPARGACHLGDGRAAVRHHRRRGPSPEPRHPALVP